MVQSQDKYFNIIEKCDANHFEEDDFILFVEREKMRKNSSRL